ncbi:protein 3 [Melampyrum roseum virus 1]|uniref:Protein 3 n=1 Tax=Melampyrum roseum virus 1 TaxID=2793732 RepID=A0A8D9UIX0_9RHAB|nr:protein 3 [Melampyrum roseum virus 1]DAF42367.1 TPA_asm: protein 3 [Melampyrum roseum virus 1]
MSRRFSTSDASSIRRHIENQDMVTGNSLLTNSLSHREKFVFDKYVTNSMPKEKVTFSKRWNWKPKGEENHLTLGKLTIADFIKNLKWSSGAMTDSEIHIIYLPHVPVDNFRHYNISVSLLFEGAEEEGDKILSTVEFPTPLHMHIIFYPGHSFSLKKGSPFPWSIKMTTDAPINRDYLLADAFVQFKAYNAPTSQYTEKRGANLISLVPLSETPTGVVMTNPRGGKWSIFGLQFGLMKGQDVKTLQRIQEIGIDIEAIQNLGILDTVVKRVKEICSESKGEESSVVDNKICRDVLYQVKKVKKL